LSARRGPTCREARDSYLESTAEENKLHVHLGSSLPHRFNRLSLDQVACIVQRRDRMKFWSQLSSDALDLRALSILVIWRQRISIRDVIVATVTGTTI
jgi:hypothetical protein